MEKWSPGWVWATWVSSTGVISTSAGSAGVGGGGCWRSALPRIARLSLGVALEGGSARRADVLVGPCANLVCALVAGRELSAMLSSQQVTFRDFSVQKSFPP